MLQRAWRMTGRSTVSTLPTPGAHHVRYHSTKFFDVISHEVRCAHTRERPAGSRPGSEGKLRLAVKQYVPKIGPATSYESNSKAVTIIAAHANGFPKELYEPLWDHLYSHLDSSQGIQIASIWIADMYNQNASAVLNQSYLGPDPSWYDHSRDLMRLINDHQDSMRQPLIAIGHSIGGWHLAQLALWHPRLFQAVVLIDPVIQIEDPGRVYASASAHRRVTWPTRREAEEAFGRSKFYQAWDSEVLDRWLDFGLRDVLVARDQHENTSSETEPSWPVTLTTPLAQEIYGYARADFFEERLLSPHIRETDTSPALQDISEQDYQQHCSPGWRFYRPESVQLFHQLPHLRPPVQYIFGATSNLKNTSDIKTHTTGSGLGGNGGLRVGGTRSDTIPGAGHLLCFEKAGLEKCANITSAFIQDSVRSHDTEMKRQAKILDDYPGEAWADLSDKWRENLGPPPVRERKGQSASGQNERSSGEKTSKL